MIVEVTQEDIDVGKAGRASLCPVARAMTRTLGKQILVLPYGERWTTNNGPLNPLSKRAARWARVFDSGKPVKPFRFRTRRPK